MKGGFRQSMRWLHTWSGLLVAWVLYFIFVTGTTGYFDTEIDRWMRPAIPVSINVADTRYMLALAERHLQQQAAESAQWSINFPVDRNSPFFSIRWQTDQGNIDKFLDPQTGQTITARETGGGNLLYRMHWRLHYMPSIVGKWLVGISSMFMLLALISGIIIHKKIFKDIFTFRPGKNCRSWLDMHNIFSVLALPFHLMITYSGLLFLAFTYMPLVISASYGPGEENKQHFLDEALMRLPATESTGIAAPMVSLTKLLAAAEQSFGHDRVSWIRIENQGDANARIRIRERQPDDSLGGGKTLIYDGVSGNLLHTIDSDRLSTTAGLRNIILKIHEGLFADTILRWLYFLAGLMATGMIATGLILWTAKRRSHARKSGQSGKALALVERLNVASIVGLLIGIAIYFWSNRVLGIDLPERSDKEVMALFISWGLTFIYAALRPVNRAWIELLWLAATLYLLLPVLNLITTQRHLGVSLQQQDWVMAGFDLTMLTCGVLFAYAAVIVQRRWNFTIER